MLSKGTGLPAFVYVLLLNLFSQNAHVVIDRFHALISTRILMSIMSVDLSKFQCVTRPKSRFFCQSVKISSVHLKFCGTFLSCHFFISRHSNVSVIKLLYGMVFVLLKFFSISFNILW
jgi:hypothetical protein